MDLIKKESLDIIIKKENNIKDLILNIINCSNLDNYDFYIKQKLYDD